MGHDTIVVGAGSSGAILASRLSEDPHRSVLLVEAGPDYADPLDLPDGLRRFGGTAGPDHTWRYVGRATAGGAEMTVPRGRVTGGSSAIHMATFIRGVPEDYDAWAAAGNDEWAFTRILPFFRALEDDVDLHNEVHGAGGPMTVRRYMRAEWDRTQAAFYEACRALGFADAPDHNHPDATGVGPLPANRRDGTRVSTAVGYLHESRRRPNLEIMPEATARRIVFDGMRATGVVVEAAGATRTIDAPEIVLCCGAIATPHLLLLSGVGPAQALRELGIPVVCDLAGVGRNVQDHPARRVTWRTRDDHIFEVGRPRIQVGLRYSSEGSGRRNDMFIVPSSYVTVERGGSDGGPGTVGVGMLAVLTLPESVGELRLRSADPRVQPTLDYRLLQDPHDRARIGEGIRLCLALGRHPSVAPIIAERLDPGESDLASDAALDEWLLHGVQTAHHISCTCAMGPASDPRAVVDQYGRVHGLRGLRVADASIMPNIVRAPIAATVMMIGERIADFVRCGH